MSHCEERAEEGTDKQHIHRPEPPSVSMKSDETGPPDTKSLRHRPESPTPSCVSMKSDQSKCFPLNFSNEPGPSNTKSLRHRPESPTPSCVSMKSDQSKCFPLNFSNEPGPSNTKSLRHRPESPTPSCVSMKSDQSKCFPLNFSNEPGPSNTKSLHHRPESPTPSCVSMKSDQSKCFPLNFSNEPGPSNTKSLRHRPESPTPSCVSMKSDQSKCFPLNFSNEPGPSNTKSLHHRPESPTPSCVSMKSDQSKCFPLNFSNEPGPSNTKERKKTEQASRCSVCEEVLTDPVSTSCGHWFCRQCITSYWDQSAPTGHCGCPQCVQTNPSMRNDLNNYKISLNSLDDVKNHMTEESGTSLTSTYTELYITEGESEGVNSQHEVIQLETASKMKTFHDTPIKCCDIFKPLPGRETPIRRVLTKGIAGIGKTFSVRKFTLDWARGLENQDVNLLVPFSFRELNLVRDEQYSLLTLIHDFHPTLKNVTAEQLAVWKVAFIFDGLDESKFSLFQNNDFFLDDATVTSSVDVLLTNLIKGNLIPSALLWITTRPAAANQIPPKYVDMVTEVRGFTDPQKEEYFRNRFSDEKQTNTVISHIKTSRTLHILCHIPLFCWIIATILMDMLRTYVTRQLPKTLTEMCCHFLLVQTKRKNKKYDETHELDQINLMKTDREVLLKLGRLAFEHLEKGNILFYKEDLQECGLDVKNASLYSGVCTEIFKRESVLFREVVYSFVHLSIQEFLAAVYLLHCFTKKNMKVLKTFLEDDRYQSDSSLSDFLKAAMKKAMKSKNGHLDLLVRFLHGLSLECNQSLLGGLLCQTKNSPESIQEAISNLKSMYTDNASPDRCINIFHCLMEMNDHSLHQEIQQYLNGSKEKLSEIQCSALAAMLLMSEEVLDEFDLDKYNTSDWGRSRLIPAVRNFRKARLVGCNLREPEVKAVGSALSSNPSHLRELDLSKNDMQYYSFKLPDLLFAGLKSPHCRLEILRLVGCELRQRDAEGVTSVLSANLSHLRELDLSENKLHGSGLLFAGLKSPHCRLEILRLAHCYMTESCCEALASAVRSNPSLKELDLSLNMVNDSVLENCIVKHGGEDWLNYKIKKYFHRLTLDTNTAHRELSLSENNRKVTRGLMVHSYPEHPDRFDGVGQVLCTESLIGRYFWEVEWSGRVSIAVTYKEISRKGDGGDCWLGLNDKSWILDCREGRHESYRVTHNSKDTVLPIGSKRVAVYLDFPAGTLSFYEGSSGSLTHLYTFQNTFTEPLYAGFWLNSYCPPPSLSSPSSVRLCEQR